MSTVTSRQCKRGRHADCRLPRVTERAVTVCGCACHDAGKAAEDSRRAALKAVTEGE